jgi:hypothetical protein
LVASFEFFLAEFSVSYTEVLAAAPEGFAVVVGVGARTDPIHPIGVRLDLNLAILTGLREHGIRARRSYFSAGLKRQYRRARVRWCHDMGSGKLEKNLVQR